MKKVLLFVFVILSIKVQAQWVQISTIGSNELRSVKFFNEYTGIIAGQGGIWRSTNSGVNWLQVLSGQNMNALSFPDNNNGYSVGDSGKIYKTTNGGVDWNQIGNGITTKKLNTVSFPVPNTGWIMGESGKILYTFNGGSSFTNQTNGDTTYDINCLQMINSTTGYFCGSSVSETFGYSPNGGINWLYTLNMNGNILYSVSHISGSIALAVGTNGRIRRTTSNGTTWIILSSPANVQLNHVIFLGINTGYIAGNSGTVLKTTNSGLNWLIDATVTSNNLHYISFINANTAWIVGDNGTVIRQGIPVGISHIENTEPKYFKLYQNYPNPFNPKTYINFELTDASFVQLTVYDVLGNEVEQLIKKDLNSGIYKMFFDASNLSSGVYMYEIDINYGQFFEYKKMVLIK